MATGWAGEGAVNEQIEATVKDAVELARSRLPKGPGLTHCAECGAAIPEARRAAVPGVRLCLDCQQAADAAAQSIPGYNRRGSKDSQLRCVAVALALGAAALLQPRAHAEQWAYAMQTGHGNHSIQVDVDSITQRSGYIAARLLYEYYPLEGPAPRSAIVEGAFDCKANRFQALSRTEYTAPQAKGTTGAITHAELASDRWRPASADPETSAIIDWVCGVAAHRLTEGQAGSMP
jgi:phage/conjugal plasmid C-4 type zinc finger TraR family protein